MLHGINVHINMEYWREANLWGKISAIIEWLGYRIGIIKWKDQEWDGWEDLNRLENEMRGD